MTRLGLWLHNKWINLRGCGMCGGRPVVAEVVQPTGGIGIMDAHTKKVGLCAEHYIEWNEKIFSPMDRDYVAT